MPMTLVTGTPGAGKTLYVVKMLVDQLVPQGRPIFHNITGLNVDADNVHYCGMFGPWNWEHFPNGSICVFDEVQQQYPSRSSAAKVPPYLSAYETHRKRGYDFYFITQDWSLVDHHVQKLCDRHIHLERPFRMNRAKVYEYQGVCKTPGTSKAATAVVTRFAHSPKYFGYYESAETHTVSVNPPWKMIAAAAALGVVFVGLGGYAVTRIKGMSGSEEPIASTERITCVDAFADMGNTVYYKQGGELLEVSGNDQSVRRQEGGWTTICKPT